jgi:hypothetical protein
MACLMARMLGCGGGPPTLFFRPAALRRRDCLDLVLDRAFAAGRWLLFMDSGLQADIYARLDKSLLERLQSFQPATFEL